MVPSLDKIFAAAYSAVGTIAVYSPTLALLILGHWSLSYLQAGDSADRS